MSQVVTIQCRLTSLNAIKRAAERCNARLIDGQAKQVQEPVRANHRLYSKSETGIGVMLDGWRYPAVIQEDKIAFDNYHGTWGKLEKLSEFQQMYSVEATLEQARVSHRFMEIKENTLEDGRIELLCLEV
jgi:hypothetical protein